MKILKNVYLKDDDLRIGYIDTEAENINEMLYLSQVVSELESAQQTTVSEFVGIFEARKEEVETIDKMLAQVTTDQHESKERCLWWIEEDVRFLFTETFLTFEVMTEEELNKYNNYKSLCSDLMNG